MDRKEVLLRACYDLLMRQVESGYVLNLLDEIIHYDDTDVDGNCLLEDLRYELGLEQENHLHNRIPGNQSTITPDHGIYRKQSAEIQACCS